MKQMRKMQSPTAVTFGLVDEIAIMGIPARWHRGAASRELLEGLPPRMATTLSRARSFLTAVADSPALDWMSSTRYSTGRPRRPPAALISSTASRMPLRLTMPKEASLPVSEA
jgi:hypothetical protein